MVCRFRIHFVFVLCFHKWTSSSSLNFPSSSPTARVRRLVQGYSAHYSVEKLAWYDLVESQEHYRLPEGIVEALETTVNAKFDVVFLLAYPHQSSENLPGFIKVLDCEQAAPYHLDAHHLLLCPLVRRG